MAKRVAVATLVGTVVAAVTLLGIGGTGSAASSTGITLRNGPNVAAGQQWTFEVDNGGGCELLDIGAKHQWTDIHFPDDFGTYTGGGNVITLQWGDKSLNFEGHFFPASHEFVGLTNGSSVSQLVQGYVSTWDGVPC